MIARRMSDDAVAAVIGAIVTLAVLGTALVYVNAYHVPRQGAALEVGGLEGTEAALVDLTSLLSQRNLAPLAHDVPLRPDRGAPPLLAGVVLSPVRAEGQLLLNASAPNVTVSVVIDAPSNGVPANDPIRQDLGGGRMRVFLLGNATAGQPVGSLRARVGGAYTSSADYRVEAGALVSAREGRSHHVAAPAIDITRVGSLTSVSWQLPILGGAEASVEGADTAQLLLRPGPGSQAGTGRVYNMSIRIETPCISAWQSALQEAIGSDGFVNATRAGPADNGTVDALIVAPPGTSLSTRAVEMRLFAIRYDVALAERSGG